MDPNFFLTILKALLHCLLVSNVPDKKSNVFLILYPLNITNLFLWEFLNFFLSVFFKFIMIALLGCFLIDFLKFIILILENYFLFFID